MLLDPVATAVAVFVIAINRFAVNA